MQTLHRMKITVLPSLLLAAATSQFATAQEITPKWFQHINETYNVATADRLPILQKKGTDTERLDGDSGMDGYSQLIRYDATRLLLGVRENGINETDPNLSAADKALALAYPDRSLIWIDAATGKPLGVAWKEVIFPADAIWIDVTSAGGGSQGGKTQAFWRFGLDDGPDGQRVLYTGYKHLILRYAPKAGGGWETTPTVAYEEQVSGVGDGLSNGDGFASWRWRDFHVEGSGVNTKILAGGGTWRSGMHPQLLVTTDGSTFKPAARVNDRDGARRNGYSLGGTSSLPIEYGNDPSRPKLSVVYHAHFPGTGYEARPDRYSANSAKPVAAPDANQQPGVYLYNPDGVGGAGLPAFNWEAAGKDGLPIDHAVDGVTRYDGNWNGALGADPALDYIVAYSMPSWNNVIPGGIQKPAWLAIHRLDGTISSGKSSFKLNFLENDEVIDDQTPTGHDWLYDPWIEVHPDKTAPANSGKAEILVSFGSAGFGVFTAENVAATLVSSPSDQTVAAGSDVTIAANVTGSPNDFQWFHNGVPVPTAPYYLGARKTVLNIKGVTPADAGTYQLKWTNPLSGAGQTATAKLTVTGSFVRWTANTDLVVNPTDYPLPSPGEVITNAASFTLRASGFAAFDKFDSTLTNRAIGENGHFRYETVAGDFDKKVRVIGLATDPVTDPVSAWARASLAVRQTTAANTPALEIAAANPAGANVVRVMGRGRVDQVYAQVLSRSYPGVTNNLPNQWLRLQRVGNAFSFYVSTNGTTWARVADQYQEFPSTVLVGTFAAPDDATGGSKAVAEFADYGDVLPSDAVAPTLVSVGTIDKKLVGVKFSEPVNAQGATAIGNYHISEGTILGAKLGVGGDAVYLSVFGLSSDTFTVSIVGGIVDLAGNPVAPGSTASGKKANWTSTDIGFIQDANNRPTPGDDPYLPGQAVALSSDENPEVEIIGGGSNAYNPGDFIHYLYRAYPGDFDVVVAVDRFDRRGFAGGYANGGIHVRSALYRTDNTAVAEVTKVPAYVNTTYYEASGPNRAPIMLNRPNAGDNYGNDAPNDNTTEVGGLLGFFGALRAINAAGDLEPKSSPTAARWLRVKRVGTSYSSSFSYDGKTWLDQDGSTVALPNLAGSVLVGFGQQNDTGYGVPPKNTYDGNGTVDADGNATQNESNYGVVRISHFGDFATAFPVARPTLGVTFASGTVTITWTGLGYTLQSSSTVNTGFAASGLPVTTVGEQNTVTLTPSEAQKFLRLVK